MNRKKPQLLLGFLGFQPVHPLLSHIQVYFDFSGNLSIASQAALWAWWLNVSLLIICCCSVAQSCLTVYDPMKCSIPGFPVLQCLQEFAQIHVHWVSDAIQPSHPLPPLLLLPSVFPSIRVFSSESALHIRWSMYWSFSIRPSNEYLGLIPFRIDWFDLLEVLGTLKSLLQHHNSKVSILCCSAFFMVQLSCPYMTTGKQ